MLRERFIITLSALCVLVGTVPSRSQTLYPTRDGTIVDGGVYGTFDGSPDAADWSFNESSYEGAITLSTATPGPSVEHRVVWEYGLSSVSLTPPVTAKLHFAVRGAPVFPFPDVNVNVYAYPADLVESMTDYSASPATLQGGVTVVAFQAATNYVLDVSGPVSDALTSGTNKVGMRFQIDPGTVNDRNQAFIDALDSDQTTKPRLVISMYVIPGDFDQDGDVDLVDFTTFVACFGQDPSNPQGSCTAQSASASDLDGSGVINLADFLTFLGNFTG